MPTDLQHQLLVPWEAVFNRVLDVLAHRVGAGSGGLDGYCEGLTGGRGLAEGSAEGLVHH